MFDYEGSFKHSMFRIPLRGLCQRFKAPFKGTIQLFVMLELVLWVC